MNDSGAPRNSVETTPFELWFGKKPKLSFLKVWGCDAYVEKFQANKLEPKADKCIFIGHPNQLGIPPNSDPKAIGIVS